MQYVYDFATLDRVPEGPTSAQVAARRLLSGATLATGKSSTVGAVLTGSSIVLTLGTQARGSGAKPHTHPNEQFNYILEGTMVNEIEGERVFAGPGTLLHTPTGAVHTGLACPDEDLVFLAIKDTRHGIVGPPVDGRYTGPNYLPGFGDRSGEPAQSTAEMIAGSGRDPVGEKTRYVYEFPDRPEKPGRRRRVKVTTTAALPGAGAGGTVITGELLHVAVLRYPRAPAEPFGVRLRNNRKAPPTEVLSASESDPEGNPEGKGASVNASPAERFVFVASGALRGEIAGRAVTVGERSIVHVPAGIACGFASAGDSDALVLVAQDNRYAFQA